MLGKPVSAVEHLRKAGSMFAQLPIIPSITARLRDQHILLALEQGVVPAPEDVSEDYWTQAPADDIARAQWTVRRLGVDQLIGRLIAREAIRDAADGLRSVTRRAQRWSDSALLARIALRANLHEEARQILVPLLAELEPMQAPDSPLLKAVRALLQEAQAGSGASSVSLSA